MALVVFLPSEDEAVGFVKDIRSSNINPEFIEYFDPNAVDLLRRKQQENPGSLPVPSFPSEAKALVFLEMAYTDDNLDQTAPLTDDLMKGCRLFDNHHFAQSLQFVPIG